MSRSQRYVLNVSRSDRRSYASLPFEVPPGTTRIDIAYAVQSAQPEECATDIGLRDPHNWRGWTGSPRRSVFVTPYHATPGYILGPLSPGGWQVVLGLYDLPESGCTIEVTVTLQESVAEWLAGDLHTHTVHSDGTLTVPQLCAFALEQGLDFLAITDHNTVSQHRQEPQNLPLLLPPGVELTTYSGHANLYGLHPPLLDFRCDNDMAALLSEARAAGMFISINHPSELDCGWEHGYELPYDAVEIWNGTWNERDAETLAHWQGFLVAGQRPVALGGSDFHGPVVAGEPLPVITRVFVRERSVEGLLDGLRSGHVVVARGVTAPRLGFTVDGAMIGDTVSRAVGDAHLFLQVDGGSGCHARLISERGIESEHRIEEPIWTLDQAVPAGRRFYRAELWPTRERQGPLVITNPIFLEPQS